MNTYLSYEASLFTRATFFVANGVALLRRVEDHFQQLQKEIRESFFLLYPFYCTPHNKIKNIPVCQTFIRCVDVSQLMTSHARSAINIDNAVPFGQHVALTF